MSDLADLAATHVHERPSQTATTLRVAAAIVEAQETTRPHLVSLRNRLLALADELTPPRTTTDDQEETP